MTCRALIVITALATLALFAFLNWAVFTAPTVLNRGFAEVNAHSKELRRQRERADRAEASRFTELHRIEPQGATAQRENGAHIEKGEQWRQDKMAESMRTLSACLGEIEDKLERAWARPRRSAS